MPFTPFHIGPGLAIEAVAGRYFSLMVFGFSQVVIDIEPLVRIIRGDAVLHGVTHTYLGAALIGLLSAVIGRPICQFLVNHWTPDPSSPFLDWLRGPTLISWPAAVSGALVGSYSHVFLDSIMHADMHPLAPLSDTNRLLHVMSVGGLPLLCVLCGVLGLVLMFAKFFAGRGAQVD